jgi:hypothetical protein
MLRNLGVVLITLMASSNSMAQSFCFALAETYYEQVYCQLQAKAQTKGLPAFHEFKNNDERVQAALLKRPAERNGIKLPVPKVAAVKPESMDDLPTKPAQSSRGPAQRIVRETVVIQQPTADGDCTLEDNIIRCSDQAYKLIGNKSNVRLVKGALYEENKMALPDHTGQPLEQYLSEAYRQYINKMCDIGLGGVTMTFGKFAYLYRDVQLKGLNFVQRFETMYSFLKKDKTTMGVSESVPASVAFTINDCSPLDDQRFVCAHQGRNYIFESQ